MPYPKSNAFEITYSIQASPTSATRLLHLEMLSSNVAGYLLPGSQLISPVPMAWSSTFRNSSLLCTSYISHTSLGLRSALTKDVGFFLRSHVSLLLEKALFPTFGCGQSRGYNYLLVPLVS